MIQRVYIDTSVIGGYFDEEFELYTIMKTETKTKKKFDAVEFMRQRREQISKDIDGMTPGEEIEYFKRKAAEFNNRDK